MCVVVQRMVDARAAGVLFTADPLSGRRSVAVIDAIAVDQYRAISDDS